MTVEIWTFERSDKPHERGALLELARALDTLSEPFLLICNPVFYGQEVDALVLKRKMVFVVEIKSADGAITGGLYSDWIVTHSDGSTWLLNGGRDGNPFQQIQREYRATLNFLKKHAKRVMTPAEAAQCDFRRIKNVLVLDPHYDAAGSQIDLEDKDKWLNVVGLHDNVAEPFWQLMADEITLSEGHMQALARDVLKCSRDRDMELLIRGGEELPLEERETEEVLPAEPTPVELPPAESEAPSDTEPPRDEEQESMESPSPAAAPDVPPSPEPAEQAPPPASPEGAEPLLIEAGRWVVEAVEVTLGTLASELMGLGQRLQGSGRPIEFEDLVFALREAADKSIQHLPPDRVVANHYEVSLDPLSYERLSALEERWVKRATEELEAYITTQRYVLDPRHDRLVVAFVEVPDPARRIGVQAKFCKIPPTVVLLGPQGKRHGLYPGDRVVIGRGSDVDWRIDDPHEEPIASRVHCAVEVAEDGSVTVQDLDSTHHTWVDGKRVAHLMVTGDAEILLGRDPAGEEGPRIALQRHTPEEAR